MKQNLFLVGYLLIFGVVRGQVLTVDETIKYINTFYSNSTKNKDKKLALTKDGVLSLNGTYFKHTMQVYDVYLDERSDNKSSTGKTLVIECNDERVRNPNSLFDDRAMSANPNRCINSIRNPKTNFDLGPQVVIGIIDYPETLDAYSTKKIFNAYKYLFALVKEDGTYKRKDDDPFASGNYNPKTIDIKGNSTSSAIKLEKDNGVYYVWITVGGILKKFVLDTGASDVLLSESTEKELIDAGVIKKENYTTSALYRIADGSVVQCRRLVLPELKIGNYTVTNVTASVGVGSVPLLLGKSFLDKFKRWTIDNLSETLNLEK